MNAKTAKAIEKLSPAELKRRFPREFQNLQDDLKEKAKKARPDMPTKLFKELEKERDALQDGEEVRLPPSKKYPFEIRFCARWEYDDCASVEDVEVFAAPKQTASEKRLITLLKDSLDYDGVFNYDDIVDYMNKSPEIKIMNRRISNFLDRLDKLSEVYDFDSDDIL